MTLKSLYSKLNLTYVSDYATDANFPYQKMPKGEIEIIYPNRYAISEEIIKEQAEKGLRPATIHELLLWAKDNWKEDMQYPIVALGSVEVRGGPSVLYLDRYGSGRRLRCSWFDDGWNDRCRFVFVRQVSGTGKNGNSVTALEPLDSLPLELEINGVKYRRVDN